MLDKSSEQYVKGNTKINFCHAGKPIAIYIHEDTRYLFEYVDEVHQGRAACEIYTMYSFVKSNIGGSFTIEERSKLKLDPNKRYGTCTPASFADYYNGKEVFCKKKDGSLVRAKIKAFSPEKKNILLNFMMLILLMKFLFLVGMKK